MNATLTRMPASSVRPHTPSPVPVRIEAVPAKPDRRLWKSDNERAFEAGVRWFLAVSRAA
jgi:hypothetical protein